MYEPNDEHHSTLKHSWKVVHLKIFPLLLNFVDVYYPAHATTLSGEAFPWPAPVLWLVNSIELFSNSRTVSWLQIWYKGRLRHSLIAHHLCKYTDTHRAPQYCDIVKAVLYVNPQKHAGQTQQHWKYREKKVWSQRHRSEKDNLYSCINTVMSSLR